MLPCTEDLATVSAVMLTSIEGMELLITLEAIDSIIIFDPFLFRAKGCLDYFLHLLVHQSTNYTN